MGQAWKKFWELVGQLFGVVGKTIQMADHLANAGVELSATAEEIAHDYRKQSKSEREAEHEQTMRTINAKRIENGLEPVATKGNPAIEHSATQSP